MSKVLLFCDESCHTPNDESDFTAIGAVYCPSSKYSSIKARIRKIKNDFGFGYREIKWSRISLKYLEMYKRIVDFFFDSQSMAFSVLVMCKKKAMYSDSDAISHFDDIYYLLYRLLLIRIISSEKTEYAVYIDKKDSNGSGKIKKLKETLQKDIGPNSLIESMEEIDSQCNDLVQIADLFCGFITYSYRRKAELLNADKAKKELHNYILKKITMLNRSFLNSNKFNILRIDGRQ